MQEALHFEIIINAPIKKVWDTMLGDKTYREWTAVFNPGSYYKGDWNKGSKILFLGPNPGGQGEGGMVSRVAENKPYEYISIEHLGIVSNGVEDTTSEEAKKWAPMFENYALVDQGEKTELKIDLEAKDSESAKAMKEMFEGMWPKALETLKELCEK